VTEWTATTLVYVDEEGDRTGASNGYSRYGGYLNARPAEFCEEGQPDTPLFAEDFAAAAWRVATPPVLIGYVVQRPDINSITAAYTENGDLLFKVEVPLWHGDLPSDRRPRYPWQDWTTEYDIAARDDKYRHAFEPDIKGDRPAVLAVANVLVSAAGWDLPAPQHPRGRGLVDEAQHVVREIAAQVNRQAGPMVAQLLGEKV
jgi:hypothetical protein